MAGIATVVVFGLYLAATLGLMAYGLNCYVMLLLFARKRQVARNAVAALRQRGAPCADSALPVVTTQVAVFNEVNVVERVIRAVCAMDYPRDRHEVQVLDDSTDETTAIAERVARELRQQSHDVKVIHRTRRTGYKGGALQEGLEQARGDFVAVFDADFVPPAAYLRSTVPFFLENAGLGFVQGRWGHLNSRRSLLTRAQSIGIDGHFIVEQVARNWNGLYMNFNGTAGIWRKTAIVDAGGWQWDTLTEDLDLSYRMQFAGWETLYLPGVVVPAELPENINALRGQQFRWAKGSFQTVMKLLPQLLRAPVSRFKKVQAFLHISGYLVHPMMLTLALLALPILFTLPDVSAYRWVFAILALPLCFSVAAPSTLYFVSQRVTYRDWVRRVFYLPWLIVIGVGLAVSNTKAILEAVLRRETAFVRTPKSGDRELKPYRIRLPWPAFVEIAVGCYSAVTFGCYTLAGKHLVTPFLAVYAAGFLFIGLLTVVHSLRPDSA